MSEGLGIFLFVIVILAIVVVHEAGHFLTAKAFKMRVEEFFVGFGPRLWSFRRGETEYGIKAIPAGGYVRIAGMNPFEEIPPEDFPNTYASKPAWQRAVVILAGPIMHFVIAIVALFIFFVAIGEQTASKPEVGSVFAKLNGQPSPAAVAGFRPGDQIVAIGGQPVGSSDRFIAYIRSHVGQAIAVEVRRDGRLLTLHPTPVRTTVDHKPAVLIGITRAYGRERVGPFTAAGRAVTQVASTAKEVVQQIGKVFGPSGLKRIWGLLTGTRQRTASDATSIVGATRLAGQAAQSGAWDYLFGIVVVFNVFVGILNLVPLPPLDGGHLAVIAYEKIRRRKPDVRKLVPLTAVVAGFFILLAVSLAYIDITNPLPNPFH
jgi:membrane-associated protease RseP (regulator of RpoE activity)